MRLKHLESALSSVPVKKFPEPNITLEQYATSAHLTASVILTAVGNDDLGPGMVALDLGCGTGMLSIGCALADCEQVIAIDCDESALNIVRENAIEMEYDGVINLILAKVNHVCSPSTPVGRDGASGRGSKGKGKGRGRKGGGRGDFHGRGIRHVDSASEHSEGTCQSDLRPQGNDGIPLRDSSVDTVVTNPPFGTKHNAGIDVTFLRTACRLARRAVYSFHKSSTREYLLRLVRSWGYDVEVVAHMRFDIPNTYRFHKKDSVDVEVDLLRVTKTSD